MVRRTKRLADGYLNRASSIPGRLRRNMQQADRQRIDNPLTSPTKPVPITGHFGALAEDLRPGQRRGHERDCTTESPSAKSFGRSGESVHEIGGHGARLVELPHRSEHRLGALRRQKTFGGTTEPRRQLLIAERIGDRATEAGCRGLRHGAVGEMQHDPGLGHIWK